MTETLLPPARDAGLDRTPQPFTGWRPPLVFHTNILTLFGAFQPWSLGKMADWALANGYEGLEVGPAVPLDAATFRAVRASGAALVSLTYGRNVLAGDEAERVRHRRNVMERLHFAAEVGIPLVVLATGRVPGQSLRANLPAVVEWLAEMVLPLARAGGITVAIENCPAVGNIATSPAMWAELFARAVPDPALQLAFDPSHLVWQMVDPYAALDEWAPRVVHVHVKDSLINRAALAREGIDGEGWWRYVLPGWGELNWARILAGLQGAGYRGALSVEQEDAAWEGSEGQVLQSLLMTRRYLEQFLGEPLVVPSAEATAPVRTSGVVAI